MLEPFLILIGIAPDLALVFNCLLYSDIDGVLGEEEGDGRLVTGLVRAFNGVGSMPASD